MACLKFVLILTLCIDPKVAESSCKDECLCQGDHRAACYATGYNGSVCERSCSIGCLDGLCDAHTGVCYRNECKQIFRGKICSKCTVEKFGEYCLEDCPPHCASCSSNGSCTSCVQGYVGEICDIMCPEGCNGNLCYKDRKRYQCKPNFVGEFCDNCTNGTLCDKDCPSNCLSCSSYNNCTECKLGYHGQTCHLTRSHGCFVNKCNQKNGTCYYGCKPEFGGDFCQKCVKGRYGKNCTSSCSSTCTEKVCKQTTGHCLNGCSFAMYGPTCEYNCPGNCETCSSSISCHTCSTGLWGELCSRKCSEGCVGSCFENGTCQNCKEGYYGSLCKLACPAKCTDLLCTAGDSGFDSEKQHYDVEKIAWISVACLLAVITVVQFAQNRLLKRRLTQKPSTISNIHTGTDNSDINTAELEMATSLPLSEGTISSYQNQQSAVYVLPRNTTASNMQNGEDVSDDISANVYSGPYEQPIEFREQNTYTGQHTNDTQTVGPYENVAAVASGATDRNGRRYEELMPERYEELTPRRWTGNYSALQEL